MSSAVEMDTGSSSDRPVAPNASSILLATLSRGTGVLAGCGQYSVSAFITKVMLHFSHNLIYGSF
jgi:hypothetical protein